MTPKVRVRPARVDDHQPISAFTQQTFSWGDYVAESFLGWLDRADSATFVAVDDDDHPLAVARVDLLSPQEAWLAAARVHPDHRRQGIGVLLNDAGVEWASTHGAVVARLLVDEDNEAPHGQVAKLGYREAARVLHAHRELAEGPSQKARLSRVQTSEAASAYASWSASGLERAAHRLACRGWAWSQFGLSRLEKAAAAGELFNAGDGWVVADLEEEGSAVWWVACFPESAPLLIKDVIGFAAGRAQRLALHAPNVEWLRRPLQAAGFQVVPAIVYEKPTG